MMKPKPLACLAGMLLILAAFSHAAAGSLPALEPAADDRCPVCGMFVAKYPDWTGQVRFQGRETVFFDGVKDLFKYYFRMAHYTPGRFKSDVAAVYVTDYYTMRPIEATAAFYVVGSDVYGPMGRELIAFAGAADAEAFMRDHSGRQILRFATITPALIGGLD